MSSTRDARAAALIRSARAVALTKRGWAFLAAALVTTVVAYAVGLRELLYVAVLLAILPLAALLFVWIGRPRLSVARTFTPHVLEAGSAASVSMVVRNLTTGRSRRARWTDTLPWRPDATPEAALPPLQPRGARFAERGNAATLRYELQPPRRGVFPVGPLRVEVVDAFGLARSFRTVGTAQPIVVTPAVVTLPDTGLSASAGDGEARLVQRKAAGDDDDVMTREYRTGDAMRRVHWRASARHGDLMVRQEEQRSLPEARIIVDTLRAGYRDLGDDEPVDAASESNSFEWVVRMLASVAVHLRRAGFIVRIEETGVPQLPALGRSRRRTWGDEELLVGLAAFGLTDEPRSHAHHVVEAPALGPVIAIVANPDPETLAWLARQRRSGELAVAFMVRALSSIDVIDRSFGTSRAEQFGAAAERLTDAGWLVVPVRDDDDHVAAWEAVVVETGRARAGA
jgi:uncharacterized protein (DUF58 family)